MASKTTPTYTDEQWAAMLTAGARRCGVNNIYAATHLLTYTSLPGHWQFSEHVQISSAYLLGPDGQREETLTTTAVVTDWAGLPHLSDILSMGGGAHTILAFAAAIAVGSRLDLRAGLTGLGRIGARRVAEAVLIATGYEGWYDVTPTQRYADHERQQRELLDTI